MTSKEALDNMCKKCSFCPFDESKCYCDEYNAIKESLDVLGILKKHLKIEKDDGFEKIVTYTKNMNEAYGDYDPFMFCNFFRGLNMDAPRDAVDDFRRVKEWLEK